jgi:hypothetical protein
MREKSLLQLFLTLNVALAACFVIYLFLSSNGQPKVVSTAFPVPAPKTNAPPKPAPAAVLKTTNDTNAATVALAIAPTNTPAAVTNETFQPVFTAKKFGWQQIQSDQQTQTNEYQTYLDSLRAVGCPEEKVRHIALTDINELFGQKRLKEAVTHDIEWWRSEPQLNVASALQEKGRGLEEERRVLIEKYLGPEAVESEKGEAMLWSNVQLTGPVLGGLPPETHNAVQEICARSIERSQSAQWARFNDGQPLNAVEMARLREQTRAELRKVLSAEGMEEFLLRYSHNGHNLRNELRDFDPTPEEFRKILRATDAADHQLQLEFGGLEALSPQQRERHLAQRDAAIKEALGPKRYQDYLLVKDPLYRQAQATATQYGAPAKAILPIYQTTKAIESRRQRILNDAALTPQQKSEALNAVNQEQMRSVQQIVTDARNRQ